MGGDWVGDDPGVKLAADDVEKIINKLKSYNSQKRLAKIVDYPKEYDQISVGCFVGVVRSRGSSEVMNIEIGYDVLLASDRPKGVIRITGNSPIGQSLIGKKVGDEVLWKRDRYIIKNIGPILV